MFGVGAMNTPLGSVSTRAEVSVATVAFALFSVMVSVETPLTMMEVGVKDFAIVGVAWRDDRQGGDGRPGVVAVAGHECAREDRIDVRAANGRGHAHRQRATAVRRDRASRGQGDRRGSCDRHRRTRSGAGGADVRRRCDHHAARQGVDERGGQRCDRGIRIAQGHGERGDTPGIDRGRGEGLADRGKQDRRRRRSAWLRPVRDCCRCW